MKVTLTGNLIQEGRLFKAGDVVDVSRADLPRLKKLGVVKEKLKSESGERQKAKGKRENP